MIVSAHLLGSSATCRTCGSVTPEALFFVRLDTRALVAKQYLLLTETPEPGGTVTAAAAAATATPAVFRVLGSLTNRNLSIGIVLASGTQEYKGSPMKGDRRWRLYCNFVDDGDLIK